MSAIQSVSDGVFTPECARAGLSLSDLSPLCGPGGKSCAPSEYTINGTRECELHRTAHLAAIEIRGAHHGTESADIEKVLAHPIARFAISAELCFWRQLQVVVWQLLTRFKRTPGENEDFVSRVIPIGVCCR